MAAAFAGARARAYKLPLAPPCSRCEEARPSPKEGMRTETAFVALIAGLQAVGCWGSELGPPSGKPELRMGWGGLAGVQTGRGRPLQHAEERGGDVH